MKKYIYSLAAIGLTSIVFHSLSLYHLLPWHVTYTDIMPFAKRALSAGWPYLDKKIEYPLLIGLFVHFMGRLGHTMAQYFFISSIVLLGIGLLTTYFLVKLLPEGKNKQIWLFWVFAPSSILFLTYNWDIIAVCFSVIAFYFVKNKRPVLASVFLSLGFSTKFFPILFLLPLLIQETSWNTRWKVIGSFIASAVLVNGFFIWQNFPNWFYFYHFNGMRMPNPGSIWVILTPLFGPWLYDVNILNITTLVLFASCYIFLIIKYRDEDFLKLCFWSTLLFLIFNKIFSPQYLLWLLPFFVLVYSKSKKWFYSLEISNALVVFLTLYYIFLPIHPSVNVWAQIFVVVRHILLIAVLVVTVRESEKARVYKPFF